MLNRFWAVLWVSLAFGGCKPAPVEPPKEPAPTVTEVRVTSPVHQLLPGETVALDAEVLGTGAFDTSVSWTVRGGGTLSATTGARVVYTSPATQAADADVTVTATSVGSPDRSGQVTLSLKAPKVTKLGLTATDDTLLALERTTLDAQLTGIGQFDRELTWTVTGGGTLSATTGEQVVYTAPSTVEADTRVTVSVASVRTPDVSASLLLNLRAPSVTTVAVSPSGSALFARETVELEATLTGEGTFSSEVRWSVQGEGRLSATSGASVVYTAPDEVSSDTRVLVTATSVQTPSRSFSATVELKAPTITAVQVSAARAQLFAGNAVVFSASVSGTGPFSSEVEWTVVSGGGSLEPLAVEPQSPHTRSVRYTAPRTATAVSATVRATSRADGTSSGMKDVQVVPVPLSINEVSSATLYNWPGWLELRNNTQEPIALDGYALRSPAVDANTEADEGIKLFPLPSRVLAPGAYVVVAGWFSDFYAYDSDQILWLKQGAATAPLWAADTFIEIVRKDTGETVDFVRFGSSTQAPSSDGAWTGTTNAPSVPKEGSEAFSFVRTPGADDTNGASDWSPRPFSTPAGPNDVPAEVIDADADGIPDSAEVEGGSFAGLNLYAMGARTGQRDLFIELDHMRSDDPGILPFKEALDKMVAVFAGRGIRVHIDVGTRFSESFDPASYNLGQGSPELPFAPSINLTRRNGEASGVLEFKAAHMDFARRPVFHYCIFGSSQKLDGSAGSSGRAEIIGNDLLVTLGSWGLHTDTVEARNQLINFQSSTLMHELGHNLGLRHGGNVDTNHKPNYLSIMNYMYQLRGLGPTTGSAAGDRYYNVWGLKGYERISTLVDSPLTDTFVMDYSDGSGVGLDERGVDEAAGMCRSGSTFVDYDDNGTENMPEFDVNRDNRFEVLRDHDDWGKLVLPFALRRSATSGAPMNSTQHPEMSVVRDLQPVSEEEPPPPAFFEELRLMRGIR